MPTQSFTARLQDAGAAIRVPRPAWATADAGRPRRLGLFVLVGLLGVLALVYLVLRLTPLSAVQRVTVVGVQGPDAPAIRRAIERAAMGQSTLGFGDGAVQRAVAGTSSITGVEIHPKFPHAVQVEVRQRLAVGAIESGGRRVAVAADGTLLPDWEAGSLPLIRDARTTRGSVVAAARSATTILGAAPAALLENVARVDHGTTVRFADGPALLFRDTDRLAAKWAAAVAVLSDPATRGATWIDLRVPDQPVAGQGAPPTMPKSSATVGRVPASNTPQDIDRTTAAGVTTTGRTTPTAPSTAATPAPAAAATSTAAAPGASTSTTPGAAGGGTPAGATGRTAPTPGGSAAGGTAPTTSSGGAAAPASQTTP